MPKFQIEITKVINASYEVTADTDDVDVVEQLEQEKLKSSEA